MARAALGIDSNQRLDALTHQCRPLDESVQIFSMMAAQAVSTLEGSMTRFASPARRLEPRRWRIARMTADR